MDPKKKIMEHEHLVLILQEHFKSNPDVLEVAFYILSTLTISDAVLQGSMNKDTEVRGIPPEAYYLVNRFNNNLTTNKFYLENFAPIKMQLVLADVKLNTMMGYLQHMERDDKKYVNITTDHVRAIILTRLDTLTLIAFLWKGVEFAEQFDNKMRMTLHRSLEHKEFFKSEGM